MKWIKISAAVLIVLWAIGYIIQQAKSDRQRAQLKAALAAGEFNNPFNFQHRCGNAASVKKKMDADGRTIDSYVLTYPDRKVSVLFSHSTKPNWVDSFRFDTLNFFTFPEMQVIQPPETALMMLGCS